MAGATGTILYKGQQMPMSQYYTSKAADDAKLAAQTDTAQGGLSPSQQRVDPDGSTTTTYSNEPTLAEREAANNRAQDRMFGQYSSFGGSGGGGTSAPAPAPAFNEQAARDAAFARAKEQSGRIAASSLEGLRNSLSRRGITGGGYAQMRGAEALAPATDRLQDFTREGLIQDYNRAGEISDREAAGALTRRGQDMSSRNALFGLLSSGGKLY